METRRIRSNEGPVLRDLYIRMRLDSPDAFGEPLAQVQARSDSDWSAMAERQAQSSDDTCLVTFDGQTAVGTVSCECMPPPALTREQMTILARAAIGKTPDATDRTALGRELVEVVQALANEPERTMAHTMMLFMRAGVDFFDLLRIATLTFGPSDQAGPDWQWDSIIAPEPTAWVGSMWVDPSYRGQGLGGQLLDEALTWARSNSMTRQMLFVTETGTNAISLYLKNGFQFMGHHIRLPSNPKLWLLGMMRSDSFSS